jgi:hypothetical protein
MKRALRVVGMIWMGFWLLGATAMISINEVTIAITFIILSLLGLIPVVKIKVEKKERVQKVKEPKVKPLTVEQQLTEQNFNISKHLKLGIYNHFYVDDENKKFAVTIGRKGKIRIYNYTDLGAFELNEDGNSIAKGKGIATAIGGLTFGLVGALVGGAGKRKSENTCTSLLVRMMVNDLDNSEVVIPFIVREVKKSNAMYINAISEAKSLIATLHYIEKQEQRR